MRLATVLLSLAMTASIASAEQAKPADPYAADAAPEAKADTKPEVKTTGKSAFRLGLRVVRVMPESHQALLFDKNRGTHVLVEVGGSINGYTVSEIDDETVTLTLADTQIILSAPQRRNRDRGNDADTAKAKPAKGGPEDPYGSETRPAKDTPEDPYATGDTTTSTTSIRTVDAPKPVNPGDGGVRVVESPDVTPTAPTTATPPPSTPPPATATPPVDPPPAQPSQPAQPQVTTSATGDLVLTRAAFRAELADFGKLANGLKASFTPNGVQLDAVTASSLFARAGLKAKDTIVAVNGQALHSIDDAAELYAHASSVKAIAIDVRRGGKPISLHVTIQ